MVVVAPPPLRVGGGAGMVAACMLSLKMVVAVSLSRNTLSRLLEAKIFRVIACRESLCTLSRCRCREAKYFRVPSSGKNLMIGTLQILFIYMLVLHYSSRINKLCTN